MFVAFNACRGQFSDRAGSLVSLATQRRMLSLHRERLTDIARGEPEAEAAPRMLLPPDAAHGYSLLCLVGGKWTTFRQFGEEAADRV